MLREKDLEISFLLDFYGELLDPAKLEAARLYFDEDLSLAEIAQNTGITRQGVRDRIEKAKSQLYTYEEKLGLLQKFRDIDSKLADITRGLEKLRGETAGATGEELGKIIEEVKTITI